MFDLNAVIIATVLAVAWAKQRHADPRLARWARRTVRDARLALVNFWYHRVYLPHRSLVSHVIGCLQLQSFFDCDCCCLRLGRQDMDVEYHATCHCCDTNSRTGGGDAAAAPSVKYCKHCISQYLESQILDGGKTQLQCLMRKCPLDDRLIRKRLTVATTRIYDRALIFKAASAIEKTRANQQQEKIWQCPATDCDFVGFISNQHSPNPPSLWKQFFRSMVKQQDNDPRRIRCPMCQIASCQFCHTVWSRGVASHNGLTCQAYAKSLLTDDDEKLLRKWERTARTQVCPAPHCRFTIEKNAGCNHVTCRCGHHFCWVCGEEWSGEHYICRNYRNRRAVPGAPSSDPPSWWSWFGW